MGVAALYDYKYPSRTAQELYGDDQLVSILRRGSIWSCAAFQFRVPKGMPWSDFLNAMVIPCFSTDPEFDPANMRDWKLDGQAFTAVDATSMAELGVGHKSLLEFTA